MKIKIAHECPLAIANHVDSLTDYNYYISTICTQIPEYFEHAKKDSRFKILDCGTFEEGKPMSDEEYLTYIDAIRPDEFIVPDHLFEKDKTIEAAKKWLQIIKDKAITCTPIAVIQGKNLQEQVECYKVLTSIFNKVAIPYDLPTDQQPEAYLNTLPEVELPASGRFELVSYLFRSNLFRFDKKHHFLGIDIPAELLRYKQDDFRLSPSNPLDFIDSIDTSSPILHGLKGIEYNKDYGNLKKNSQMMKTLILEDNIDTIKRYLIEKNIKLFKI